MLLIAEVLMVLLQSKTNDSVEMAVTALKESGALLQDNEPAMLRAYAPPVRSSHAPPSCIPTPTRKLAQSVSSRMHFAPGPP